MTIIRSRPAVVAIERSLIEDYSISFGARGLMAYIDAQADGYTIDASAIAFQCHEGYMPASVAQVREIVRGFVTELIAAGYLEQV